MDQPTQSRLPSHFEEIDHLPLGKVTGDFLPRSAFLALCKMWLHSAEFQHIVTLNPEMVVEAESDDEFCKAVQRADIRIPDGAGLIWAQWYIRSEFWALFPSLLAFSFRHVERIPGVEVVYALADMCADEGLPLYLLGGTAAQVEGARRRLQKKFPGLHVFVSPEHTFDVAGPPEIIRDIQGHGPAVLLVAYGAPKQTLWIERHRQDLPTVRIAVGVGGAFAILSEEKRRAPRWMRHLNVEWLWRLLLEPSRFPRIWQAVVKFPQLIRRQKIHTYSH
ncbi:MAG: WecB/TagA/CpsF family glycosyltransferase [Patescibacteria group bacterium]